MSDSEETIKKRLDDIQSLKNQIIDIHGSKFSISQNLKYNIWASKN